MSHPNEEKSPVLESTVANTQADDSGLQRVLIMAGGTGGHVFPALAVADELKQRAVSVEWLGTEKGMEADLIPRSGYPLNAISVVGLRGTGWRNLARAPLQLLLALWQCLTILRRLRPQVVIGMGGYCSGPGGVAARLMGIPLIIHEQNSVAGTTNRLLAPLARRVLQAFPQALPKGIAIGNPVREAIAKLEAPQQRLAGREGPMRLLILGGSLGAAVLNEKMPLILAQLPADKRPLVRHQTGKRHLAVAREHYAAASVDADVVDFIDDMAEAYGWADVVIARAGALTVAELCCAGVGAILIPYPYAIDDHQTGNAQWFVDAGAGHLMQQKDWSETQLLSWLDELISSESKRIALAEAARGLALPDATEAVVQACIEVSCAS